MLSKKLAWVMVWLMTALFFAISSIEAQMYLRINKLTSDFPNGTAFVSVFGGDSKPMSELRPENFTVYADRHPIKELVVQPFERSNEGVSVVVAVDASGTVRGKALTQAKDAINQFISELRPQDFVSVIFFHDNVKLASFEPSGTDGNPRFTAFKDDEPLPQGVPQSTQFLFTNDKEELAKAVNHIKVGGRITVLYQAINRAVEIAANAPTVYKGVVVLSDGHNEDPAYDKVDEPIEQARGYEIPVFTLGVGWEQSKWLTFMTRIGNETGAIYRPVSKSDQLFKAYHSLKEVLMQQYVLSFRFENIPKDGKEHQILITVADGGQENAQQVAFKAPVGLSVVPPQPSTGTTTTGSIPSTEKRSPIIPLAFAGFVVIGIAAVVYLAWKKNSTPPTPPITAPTEVEKSETLTAESEATESQETQINPTPESEEAESADSTNRLGTLTVKGGKFDGQTLSLEGHQVLVGSGSDNQIVLEDDALGDFQIALNPRGGGLCLVDMSETVVAKVNGELAENSIDLNDGDTIQIGEIEFVFNTSKDSGEDDVL
jgi:Mg-chelatase subunit ChlD